MLFDEIMEHAAACYPNECCGLVVDAGKKHRLIRGVNESATPRDTFQLDEECWYQVNDDETVIGIYHSHTTSPPNPSMADLTGCEATKVRWHIVSYPEGGYVSIEPKGFEAPYLRRPYTHGVHDCYTLIKDWYNREWQLGLPDIDHEYEWWLHGQDLYTDNYAKYGFVSLIDQEVQFGDLFLIQMGSDKPNHSAIYVGAGRILHHVHARLSSQDVYGGMWAKHTVAHLRHKSRMSLTNG